MQVLHSIAELKQWRQQQAGASVGFVPTMGNLHAGHEALMAAARQQHAQVVASIFVNPLQFGPNEDFASYPRTLDADCQILEKHKVDAVFAPSVAEMYPAGALQTSIQVGAIEQMLCGLQRPGHFAGVATVVIKLLNLVSPVAIYFGEKDYQQLAVIRQVVADLSLAVAVQGVPTVRAADGLALSSRNQYLTPQQRQVAPELSAALRECLQALKNGHRDYAQLEQQGMARLDKAGFAPEYFAIKTPELAQPAADTPAFRVLAAARLGQARLIDNMGCTVTP